MILLRMRWRRDTVLRWTKTLNAKSGEKNVSSTQRKLIDLANYVASSSPLEFWASRNDYSKFDKMAPRRAIYLSGICGFFCEEWKLVSTNFNQNTSQANYFEGFWRITSKTNTKIEVRKQFESFVPIADSYRSAADVVETQWSPSRLAFA